MEFSNQLRTKAIKRNFNLIVVAFILAAFYFLWKEADMIAIFIGIGFVVFLILIFFINYNYVSFSTANRKIVLRYYPVISIFNREYNSIDFPQKILYKYKLKRTFLYSDLTLVVKTRRGIADYPPVSLTALKKDEIETIRQELETILGQSGR